MAKKAAATSSSKKSSSKKKSAKRTAPAEVTPDKTQSTRDRKDARKAAKNAASGLGSGIQVRAKQAGEYPPGTIREAGDEFTLTDKAHHSDAWMERI